MGCSLDLISSKPDGELLYMEVLFILLMAGAGGAGSGGKCCDSTGYAQGFVGGGHEALGKGQETVFPWEKCLGCWEHDAKQQPAPTHCLRRSCIWLQLFCREEQLGGVTLLRNSVCG